MVKHTVAVNINGFQEVFLGKTYYFSSKKLNFAKQYNNINTCASEAVSQFSPSKIFNLKSFSLKFKFLPDIQQSAALLLARVQVYTLDTVKSVQACALTLGYVIRTLS